MVPSYEDLLRELDVCRAELAALKAKSASVVGLDTQADGFSADVRTHLARAVIRYRRFSEGELLITFGGRGLTEESFAVLARVAADLCTPRASA